MTLNFPTARRMTFLLAFGTAVLVAAAPAQAQIGLPAISQHVDTPAGYADVAASESGANVCADLATPAVPAVPVPALPLPVAVPALPSPYANAKACADAGLDGVHASADTDAMGHKTAIGADADTSDQHETAKGILGSAKGFVNGLLGSLKGLF